MAKKNNSELSRAAAADVVKAAAMVLGGCCLLLYFAVWRQEGEPARFYDDVPGVDLRDVPPARRQSLVKTLNTLRCSCGCMRSVAACRNRHKTCEISLPMALSAAQAARMH